MGGVRPGMPGGAGSMPAGAAGVPGGGASSLSGILQQIMTNPNMLKQLLMQMGIGGRGGVGGQMSLGANPGPVGGGNALGR